MRLAVRSTLMIATLAAAAIAAPVASARPNTEPQQPPRGNPSTGFVTAAAGAEAKTTGPRPEVHPNADHQTTQTRPLGLPILRAAPTTAASTRAVAQAARGLAYTPNPPTRYRSPGRGVHASTQTGRALAAVPAATHDSSFDWGDAAIGAAGGLVISLLIMGGAYVVTHRRQPTRGSHRALAG